MEMITITSREMVKPTCEEVLLHKKPFKLSVLDQLIPPIYLSNVLFYTQPENSHLNAAQLIHQLKQSLSKTLNRFYPLSGRLVENMYIGSYEEGVTFVEAKVKGYLSDYVEQTDKEEAWMNELLPCQPYCIVPYPTTVPLLAIQVNLFDCGGIALGVCGCHKMVDGSTLSCFIKTWSDFNRGGYECDINSEGSNNPDFDLLHAPSLLFPPMEHIPRSYVSFIESLWISEAKCRTKNFVFDTDAIATLKLKAAKSEVLEHPTRVAALTAFVWKHAILASRSASGVSKSPLLGQTVNLRPRMKSQLPNYAIGNLFWFAITAYDSVEEDIELPDLAYLAREAVTSFDKHHLNLMRADIGQYLEVTDPIIEQVHEPIAKGNAEFFVFSSWLNTLDEKGVDFGWGEPILFVTPKVETRNGGRRYCNFIVFKEVIGQPGAVEAWITLEEKAIAMLEQDQEFLQFASPITYHIKQS